MPDPAQMSDDDLDAAIANPPAEDEELEQESPAKEGAEGEEPKETPEEPAPEQEEEEPEEEEGEEEEEPAKPEKKISRREALRVRDLLSRGQPEEEPAQPKGPTAPSALDYEKALEADPETIRRLEEDRKKVMQESWNEGMSQAASLQFHTRLEIDAPRVEAKYPQLDRESDSYKESAAYDINTMYLALAGYDKESGMVANPNLRYGAFVDTIYNLAKDIASEDVPTIVKNRAKQRTSTGLRPDGSSPKRLNLNKAPEDMTNEELDAALQARGIPVQTPTK